MKVATVNYHIKNIDVLILIILFINNVLFISNRKNTNKSVLLKFK